MIRYLALKEILFLHYKVVEKYGGLHGVRSDDRLSSLVEAPKQEAFGEQQYKTVYEKAAVYTRNIIGDHPFLDGNKRTGITAAVVFLTRNRIDVTASPKELEDFAVKVATDSLDVAQIAEWLEKHSATSA